MSLFMGDNDSQANNPLWSRSPTRYVQLIIFLTLGTDVLSVLNRHEPLVDPNILFLQKEITLCDEHIGVLQSWSQADLTTFVPLLTPTF